MPCTTNHFKKQRPGSRINPERTKYIRLVCYSEEGGVVLLRGWYATLKRVVWYFEEGGMLLWRGWYATLKRVVCYFEEGGMLLWRGWYATLKRLKYQLKSSNTTKTARCNLAFWSNNPSKRRRVCLPRISSAIFLVKLVSENKYKKISYRPLQSSISTSSKKHATLIKVAHNPLQSTTQPSSKHHTILFKVLHHPL